MSLKHHRNACHIPMAHLAFSSFDKLTWKDWCSFPIIIRGFIIRPIFWMTQQSQCWEMIIPTLGSENFILSNSPLQYLVCGLTFTASKEHPFWHRYEEKQLFIAINCIYRCANQEAFCGETSWWWGPQYLYLLSSFYGRGCQKIVPQNWWQIWRLWCQSSWNCKVNLPVPFFFLPSLFCSWLLLIFLWPFCS